jgi:exodeoxyribonuclease III
MPMRIISWNVNGLRACVKKGFLDILAATEADVFAVQEVRAFKDQLGPETTNPDGWELHMASAEKPGYSGVGFYTKRPPDRIEHELGIEELDREGRCIIAHFGRTAFINAYFPKGSGPNRDNSRVPYKMAFYDALFQRMQQLRKRGPVFVMGDYNTAHAEIDLARPKTNHKNSGFLPEERKVMDDWVSAGWSDTFRRQHPEESGHYTWWRQWGGARENNVGWRIDYIFASPSAQRQVQSAYILPQVTGSDHCPVGIDLK